MMYTLNTSILNQEWRLMPELEALGRLSKDPDSQIKQSYLWRTKEGGEQVW